MRTCIKCKKHRADYFFTPGSKNQCVECHRALQKECREKRRKSEAGLNRVVERSLIVPIDVWRSHTAQRSKHEA